MVANSKKFIGISGSSQDGNTSQMVRAVLEATGRPFEIIFLPDYRIAACNGCVSCFKTHRCSKRDDMQLIYPKLIAADAIVLGSPTHFDNVSGPMKMFMDRCLPYYMSGKLIGKKVALVSPGNLKDFLEFDENGICKWHKEELRSINKCVSAMKNFARIVDFKIVGAAIATHSDVEAVRDRLVRLGKKLSV